MKAQRPVVELNEEIREKATEAIRIIEENLDDFEDETWVWNNLFFVDDDGSYYVTLSDISYGHCTVDTFRLLGPLKVLIWWEGDKIVAVLEGEQEDSDEEEPKTVSLRARAQVSFYPGQHVRHSTFGEGVVVSSKPVVGVDGKKDEEVAVNFATKGHKRLLASFARLEVLD